jgi:hypothetical protein
VEAVYVEGQSFDPNEPEQLRQMHAFFGPQQVDHQIRQAIQSCWMALPADRKTVDGVEKEIRRIVDRALKDLRDDYQSFGLPTE